MLIDAKNKFHMNNSIYLEKVEPIKKLLLSVYFCTFKQLEKHIDLIIQLQL